MQVESRSILQVGAMPERVHGHPRDEQIAGTHAPLKSELIPIMHSGWRVVVCSRRKKKMQSKLSCY
jgi:hypothetical protein